MPRRDVSFWVMVSLALILAAPAAAEEKGNENPAPPAPDPEANEATTRWAVLALASGEKADPSYAHHRERALAWLQKSPSGEGNEPAALRLVLEQQFGDPARVKTLAEELVKRQNPDGSW